MAGQGYKPPKPAQKKQSVHFRLPNAVWEALGEYCQDKRIKKQALFEFITRALISGDYRVEEIVTEALDDRRQKQGFDDIDLKQIQDILNQDSKLGL
jgi:hypothetical protein